MDGRAAATPGWRRDGVSRARLSGRAGFSLVEVLVTLVILGLAASLVIGAILPASRNAVRRGERLSAEREARSTLEGLLALSFDDIGAGTLGPATIAGYPDAERTVVITPRGSRVWTIEVRARVGDEEVHLTCLKGKRDP